MILVIDGLQLAGKSTLIEKLKDYKKMKFDFSRYSREFDINPGNIGAFQLGKDLALLYSLKSLHRKNQKIVLDRGVFSSIYYSLLYKRLNEEDILNLLDIIQEEFNYEEIKYIFIIPKRGLNLNLERNKHDSYDDLEKEIDNNILNFIKNECEKRNINLIIFINDFSKSVNFNSERLKEMIK